MEISRDEVSVYSGDKSEKWVNMLQNIHLIAHFHFLINKMNSISLISVL